MLKVITVLQLKNYYHKERRGATHDTESNKTSVQARKALRGT